MKTQKLTPIEDIPSEPWLDTIGVCNGSQEW